MYMVFNHAFHPEYALIKEIWLPNPNDIIIEPYNASI